MSDDGPPTFLVGLGAMRAGTTWLHGHLAASPQFAAGPRKEWHVLDVVDLPSSGWLRRRLADTVRRASHDAARGRPVDPGLLARAAMVLDPDLYPSYVADLLAPGAARLACDLTPSYALLSAERLMWLRDALGRHGVRMRAVFVMRDPVGRLWSHLRLRAARAGQEIDATALLDALGREPYESRTRYERTLTTLARALPPADVHLALYEQLFTETAVTAVARFAGIVPHPGRFDLRANAAPSAPAPVPDAVARRIAEHYEATYAAVAAALPEVDLRATWPSSAWVLGRDGVS